MSSFARAKRKARDLPFRSGISSAFQEFGLAIQRDDEAVPAAPMGDVTKVRRQFVRPEFALPSGDPTGLSCVRRALVRRAAEPSERELCTRYGPLFCALYLE